MTPDDGIGDDATSRVLGVINDGSQANFIVRSFVMKSSEDEVLGQA